MTEDKDHRPKETGGFRLNFVLIATLHLIVLGVVLLLAIFPFRKKDQNLVWMNPGSFASGSPMTDSAEGGTSPDNATGQKENSLPSPEPTFSPPPTSVHSAAGNTGTHSGDTPKYSAPETVGYAYSATEFVNP